ncbi:MAG: pitrilysin family protein [Pseudomonadota bacterium]
MTVQLTTLANGLTVASDRVASVETVSVGAWVDVGTRHEPPEVNGIAHLLEHMAFKGTKRRTALEIAEQIEAVGGHLNAYTGRENTAYYAKVLADDAPLALDVIADILQDSVFDADELAREREVVLQEIGQAHDTPDDIIFDHFQETAYPDQALGRPVLGRAEIVAGLARENLQGYMAGHYGASRMVVAAAGKIEHEDFVAQVQESFDHLPEDSKAALEPAAYTGGEYRENRDLEQVHLLLGFEGVGYRDQDHYGAMVLSSLFGGGMSSRLFQEVREKRGLAYAVYSFVSAFSDGGLFGVYAGTGTRQAADLIPLVCDELNKVAGNVGADELARAKTQLKASVLMSRESTGCRCEQLAQQILTFGRALPVEEIVDKIEAVDEAMLARLTGRLTASRPCLAALGPLDHVASFDRLEAHLS